MNPQKTFYSNGKLLITGEYLVLDGAKALALPTKFGQNLTIEEKENLEISWTSYDSDGSIWFEEKITFSEITNPVDSKEDSIKHTLIKILHEAYLLNPNFINQSKGYRITTGLTFPKKWGLGTSSTLINNIAQWLKIDAFELLQKSFGGSGYDIACAQNNTPIIYQLTNGKPKVKSINFLPDFTDKIYFVYLNKKQSSKAAIANYRKNKTNNTEKNVLKIDKITQEVINAKTAGSMALAIANHEAFMSTILETTTAKEDLFSDFNGEIKSLGAWGGDFVMVISEVNPITYFTAKGFNTIIPYKEMILD
ncbi:GYDIA family GHMP kinase [Flavobacterium flavipallidum]|uniref:GYDIA family GHMP kinase n=1 Tax=Flavobacterium flavipallidum TaxID=3139140 RepID=A0ABU9HL59_9FLAO